MATRLRKKPHEWIELVPYWDDTLVETFDRACEPIVRDGGTFKICERCKRNRASCYDVSHHIPTMIFSLSPSTNHIQAPHGMDGDIEDVKAAHMWCRNLVTAHLGPKGFDLDPVFTVRMANTMADLWAALRVAFVGHTEGNGSMYPHLDDPLKNFPDKVQASPYYHCMLGTLTS